MKCCKVSFQLAVVLVGLATHARTVELKDKRQVGTLVVNTEKDRDTAESGFAGAIQAGSKYFQYAHVPAKDHYDFGHRRGNEHHFIERHEKAHPHAGEFKTKVRWGDKHGGYGEHYWDFNHAGHGNDGDGEESEQQSEYAAYESSEQAPQYVSREKRQPKSVLGISDDVEYISEDARSFIENGYSGKHGGNYKSVADREKRNDAFNAANLAYDPVTGKIVDQKSGRSYTLQLDEE